MGNWMMAAKDTTMTTLDTENEDGFAWSPIDQDLGSPRDYCDT